MYCVFEGFILFLVILFLGFFGVGGIGDCLKLSYYNNDTALKVWKNLLLLCNIFYIVIPQPWKCLYESELVVCVDFPCNKMGFVSQLTIVMFLFPGFANEMFFRFGVSSPSNICLVSDCSSKKPKMN